MWKSFRMVMYMQNNFRITRLKCLETYAKIKYKTLDTVTTQATLKSVRNEGCQASTA